MPLYLRPKNTPHFPSNGQRYTTARAYLEPESERKNLHVLLGAHASRVLFDGTKANGVEYIRKGERKTVSATKEVQFKKRVLLPK